MKKLFLSFVVFALLIGIQPPASAAEYDIIWKPAVIEPTTMVSCIQAYDYFDIVITVEAGDTLKSILAEMPEVFLTDFDKHGQCFNPTTNELFWQNSEVVGPSGLLTEQTVLVYKTGMPRPMRDDIYCPDYYTPKRISAFQTKYPCGRVPGLIKTI
ncbi:hypothetical protein HQ571_05975 [Candidatus Kuenenbacteria bacterium]|nr:hypothetical protein [Candidatus Kuenenbacteria bacterium]